MPDTVAQRVIAVIAATQGIPPESITLESTPFSLGIDSLDALNVIFNLEKEFKLRVRSEEALYAGNVGQLAARIEKKLSEAATGAEV
jgi:acyl carrier protein